MHSSTTLAACGTLRPDCIPAGKAQVKIDEARQGRERLKVVLRKLVPPVTQAQFGDPAAGTTRYDLCVYDDALRLVGSLTVDRAAAICGTSAKPCWKPLSSKGYRYTDRDAMADGVRSIVAAGGQQGRGKLVVKARNDERKGQASMPLGMTAALQLSGSVTVRALTSDGDCFGATLIDIRSAEPTTFRAE